MHTHPKLNIGLAVLTALGLMACNKSEPPAATQKTSTPATTNGDILTVKIGLAAPLTGPQAHLGKDYENGARLALEDINATGIMIDGKKVKFELMAEDDQSDPKTATTVAQKLVDSKVNGVIGHLNSGTTIPASKLYSDAGIVQISASATAVAYTAQGFKTAFRVMANDAQQGKVLGEFAAKELAAKKIAIIDDRTAYGQGLADEFEKAAKAAGSEIVTRQYTTDKATDFMAILTTIKGKKPDLIFYGGMDAQAAPMVKQIKQLNLNLKLLGGDGMHTAEFIKLAGEAGIGTYASLPGVPLNDMPGGKAFSEKFKVKHGVIQLYSPYVYDATTIMVNAMKKANSTDPQKYLGEIKATMHSGITANAIAFDEKGDLKDGAITVYKVESGDWKTEKVVGAANTPSNK